MPQSLVRSIVQNAAGEIWLATEKDGVCRFAENSLKCSTNAAGLSDNSIKSLFIDRENTLWAATTERGINRVTLANIQAAGGSTGNAQSFLDRANADKAAGNFKSAYDSYRKAYKAAAN